MVLITINHLFETGWLDNAGSFDKLIPLLSKGISTDTHTLDLKLLPAMGYLGMGLDKRNMSHVWQAVMVSTMSTIIALHTQ